MKQESELWRKTMEAFMDRIGPSLCRQFLNLQKRPRDQPKLVTRMLAFLGLPRRWGGSGHYFSGWLAAQYVESRFGHSCCARRFACASVVVESVC